MPNKASIISVLVIIFTFNFLPLYAFIDCDDENCNVSMLYDLGLKSEQKKSIDEAICYYSAIAPLYSDTLSQTEIRYCADAFSRGAILSYISEKNSDALNFAFLTIQLCNRHGFDDLLPEIYKITGTLIIFHGDHFNGYRYYKTALDKAREMNNSFVEHQVLRNLVIVSCSLNRIDEAELYFDEVQKIGLSPKLYNKFFYEGMINLAKKDNDSAMQSFKNCIAQEVEKQMLELSSTFVAASYAEISTLFLE